MKIVLIGDSKPPLDEGMKKVSYAIATEVSKYSPSLLLSPFDFEKFRFWEALRKFKPDIVHYIPGPSLFSFIFLRLIKQWTSAKTVMSMTHPDKNLSLHIAKVFKPDIILFQSRRTESLYRLLGNRCEFLPNGIDLNLFKPVDFHQKMALRVKFGIPKGKFIVLHVGNLKARRNLEILKDLQSEAVQVVVVGGKTVGSDSEVKKALLASGVIIIEDYIEGINEFYQLSDLYIFPTINPIAAIEQPLSVMEAMACNLYIIASRFGALPDIFSEKDGFFFVDSVNEMRDLVELCKNSENRPATRNMVMDFQWEKIGLRLVGIYQNLLENKKVIDHE